MAKKHLKIISIALAAILFLGSFAAAAAQTSANDPLAQYPSYTEWKNNYRAQETDSNYAANIRITSEEEWLQLVDDTNALKTIAPYFTSLSRSVTIHLDAADGVFDMKNQAMYPLGYNSTGFLAHINGHDQVFENINITLNNPTHHVGLISMISIHRVYQNFGVGSGKIEVTGAMAIDQYIGAIAGAANASGGKAQAGILRKVFNNATVIAQKNDVNGILGSGNSWPVIDGCFNTGWLEVTSQDITEYNGTVAGINCYAGNRICLYNSFANSTALYNFVSEYRGIGYHGNVFNAHNPITNCYGGAPFITLVNDLTPAAQAEAINAAAATISAQESAYKLNQSYVPVDYAGIMSNFSSVFNFNSAYLAMVDTDPIYYTLNEKGEVRFGTAENQIRKVTLKCDSTDKTLYLNANSTTELNYAPDANYYSLVGGSTKTTLVGNRLNLGNEDATLKIWRNVNRGDVNGDTLCNLIDAQIVLRQVVGLTDTADLAHGDANFNSMMDVDDAVLIIRGWLEDPNCTFQAGLPDAEGWLKVASYNIKALVYCPDPANIHHSDYWTKLANNEPGHTVDYGSQYQADECAQILRAADADLVGMQEIRRTSSTAHTSCASCQDNAKTMANLAGYSYQHMAIDVHSKTVSGTHTVETGSAILGKFDVNAPAENVYLDAQYNSEHRMYTRYTISGSALTAYGFPAESTLVFYNCHLGHYTRQQMAQMGQAMEEDYAKGYYVIATGDFNQNPERFNNCSYGDYFFDISTSHFTMANGGKTGVLTNGERQQIDNILISDNLEFHWDPASKTALHRVDVDTVEGFTPDHTAGAANAPAIDGMTYNTTLEYASDHSLVYAYIRPKNA